MSENHKQKIRKLFLSISMVWVGGLIIGILGIIVGDYIIKPLNIYVEEYNHFLGVTVLLIWGFTGLIIVQNREIPIFINVSIRGIPAIIIGGFVALTFWGLAIWSVFRLLFPNSDESFDVLSIFIKIMRNMI